jgi:hypothetical protein
VLPTLEVVAAVLSGFVGVVSFVSNACSSIIAHNVLLSGLTFLISSHLTEILLPASLCLFSSALLRTYWELRAKLTLYRCAIITVLLICIRIVWGRVIMPAKMLAYLFCSFYLALLILFDFPYLGHVFILVLHIFAFIPPIFAFILIIVVLISLMLILVLFMSTWVRFFVFFFCDIRSIVIPSRMLALFPLLIVV